MLANGPFAGSDYNVQFTGSTFTVVSGSEGAGNYTYTGSGNTAQLVMNYTSPAQAVGDNDNFTVTFSAADGAGGTFTGSQFTGNTTHPGVNGTITRVQ